MGHINRHRTHGGVPKRGKHGARHQEKNKVDDVKRRRRRRKVARSRDRRRVERVTSTYGYNTYHTCTSKRYYHTREKVAETMVKVEALFGRKCYGYHCPYCGGWHLSSHDLGDLNEGFGTDEIRLGDSSETV